MIKLFSLAQFNSGLRRFGEFGFQHDDRLRFAGCLRGIVTHQLEHFGNVFQIFIANPLRLVIGFGIVIAIRQAQATLKNSLSYFFAVLEILGRTGIEKRREANRM